MRLKLRRKKLMMMRRRVKPERPDSSKELLATLVEILATTSEVE